MFIQQGTAIADVAPVQFEALTEQLVTSIGRLANLEGQRVSLTERIKADPGEARLRRLLVDVNSEITGEKAKIEELKARIKEARDGLPAVPAAPAPPGVIEIPPPFADDRVFGMNKNESTFAFFLALPMVIALSVLLVRRRVARPAPPAALSDERLARLEQAVESVAIEVERIGESQRFQAKLMAERQPAERS